MASNTVKINGLSELLKNMEQLPRELVSNNGGLVRAALFVAAKRIRDQARAKAPEDTGNLARNIIVVRDKNPKASGASERYMVTVRGKRWTQKAKQKAVRTAGGKIDYRRSGDAFYWKWVEFGDRFTRARPFLRPAFTTEKDAAVNDFKDSLGKGIQRVVRKIKKGIR
jgi:HK97 gp10 family phage protein